MSDNLYGPIDWSRRAAKPFHADAGRNLPAAVTLSSPSGVVELEDSDGGRTVVDGVTVTSASIVDGEHSGRSSQGVDFALTPGDTPPAIGSDYYVMITATRSDGYPAVIQVPLVIHP